MPVEHIDSLRVAPWINGKPLIKTPARSAASGERPLHHIRNVREGREDTLAKYACSARFTIAKEFANV